jgi:hypothetical protein
MPCGSRHDDWPFRRIRRIRSVMPCGPRQDVWTFLRIRRIRSVIPCRPWRDVWTFIRIRLIRPAALYLTVELFLFSLFCILHWPWPSIVDMHMHVEACIYCYSGGISPAVIIESKVIWTVKSVVDGTAWSLAVSEWRGKYIVAKLFILHRVRKYFSFRFYTRPNVNVDAKLFLHPDSNSSSAIVEPKVRCIS